MLSHPMFFQRMLCRLSSLFLWSTLGILVGFSSQAIAQQSPESANRTFVVLVGDSTVADEAGWGGCFAACLADGVECSNLALGGCSSSSFRAEGRWQMALDLHPEWVLIQFGHNDEPGHPGRENPPEEGYRKNIRQYVEEARSAGIKPVLVTPLSRRQWGKDVEHADRIVSSLEPYAEVVKSIAAELDVPLIDLHWRSQQVYQSLGKRGCEMISPRKENGQWDGTHLNQAGKVLFGSLVAMDCRSYIPGLDGRFPTSKLAELQNSNRPPSMSESNADQQEDPAEPTALGERTMTVARDGNGDYRTLQEAIDSVPANNLDRTTIRLEPGVYMGQIIVPRNKPNLTLVGTDRKKSIVSYALTVHDPIPPDVPRRLAGYGFVVLANDFRATNLTIQQVAGDHGQAIALRIDGDRAIIDHCDLLGWQDTVRLEKGRHYLRDCYLEGRVDYIYGGGTAVLENCTVHTKRDGYITAASTSRDQKWGFVFLNCNLTGTGKNAVYLGRPWRPFAQVAYLNCHMDESIRPEAWNNWRNEENEKTARYAEYNSSGPGANPKERAPWSRQLSSDEAAAITSESVLAGNDNWNPTHPFH